MFNKIEMFFNNAVICCLQVFHFIWVLIIKSFDLIKNMSKELMKCPEMDYFMKDSVSDVVFIIEGQRLPADKHFLSIRNRVFRAMFSGNFKESKDKEVVIEDTTFEAFKTLIQFIYTDKLILKEKRDIKLISDVYTLSDRYQDLRLVDKMAEHMRDPYTFSINKENIELVSRIAGKSQNKELFVEISKFIDSYLGGYSYDQNLLNSINKNTNNHLMKWMACYIHHKKNCYPVNYNV